MMFITEQKSLKVLLKSVTVVLLVNIVVFGEVFILGTKPCMYGIFFSETVTSEWHVRDERRNVVSSSKMVQPPTQPVIQWPPYITVLGTE
jgi:hypothetical protein